jgi:hypothetical protein
MSIRRTFMKKLLVPAALAVALLAASPALAAAKHPNNGAAETPNIEHLNRSGELQHQDEVMRGGRAMGADPDPNVRSEMMREYKRAW